jgi:hypothetical protein
VTQHRGWPAIVGWLGVGISAVTVGAIGLDASAVSTTPHPHASVRIGIAKTALPVFPRILVDSPTHAIPGERLVPDASRPGHRLLVDRARVIALHVVFARVRAVAGRWQVELSAPNASAFHDGHQPGNFYAVTHHGVGYPLFFVFGSSDRTNFAIPTGTTRAASVRLARSLTTSVVIG